MLLESTDDVTEVFRQCLGERENLLLESELGPAFFDLTTGVAGELFQKFVNYHSLLVIIVANPESYGVRFTELVFELRDHANIRFFDSEVKARAWLIKSV
jgi:hypothetical protein